MVAVPTPIDPKRLPGLKRALAEFKEDDWASGRQLAELYGVSPSRFTTLVKTRFSSFPPADRRGDKTNWYQARPAIAAMIAYMEDTARGKQRRAARHREVLGSVEQARADVVPEREPLTASELDRMASALTRAFRLRREQGEYVLASEVRRISRGVNAMLSREVMNIVNVIDPNGELAPLVRQRLSNTCRKIVIDMHDILGRFLEEEDDAGRSGDADRARGRAEANPRRRRRAVGGGDLEAVG